ncbi:bifunctional phosphoglucose/phosphomannose isomerase [Candidatus Bathyarchaeota archaeon]|nr:MAG: bifunctional phosphoglucose/phosphomannose isomerase [Candidatus Bathyarchaeota archaeon]
MEKNKADVLDRLEKIRSIDKSNMLGHCVKTHEYCEDAVRLAKQVSVSYGKPQRILVVGMGGSAIGGELLRGWLLNELPIPIEVCRDYVLPAYVNEETLVFAISCSGNTEETLSAFVDAVKRGCMVITITSGGHLLSFSEKLHVPHLTIPSGLPPRATLPYLFVPLPILMEKLGILQGRKKEIQEAVKVIEKLSRENSPETPVKNNLSKKLALELDETIPVVYGFREYAAVAHRLKTQFNENSKVPCKHEVFPELNHNEVVGWEASEALTKCFSVLLIRDRDEPPEIKSRIEATKSLALNKAKKVLELYARGESKLARMFSVLHVGDFVSVYLAVLRNIDPTPVETIDKIKEEMRKKFNLIEKLEKEVQLRIAEKAL